MLRMAISHRPLASLTAGALGVLVAVAPAPGGELEGWARLDTPSFTFFSNAGDDATRRYAGELETFRQFVARTLGDGAVTSPLPTHVYLFDGGFEDVSLGPGNVGWFTGSRQANLIAVDTSSRGGIEIAYHEYVHFVVENSTPAIPLWLNEGLAEFYSTFQAGDQGLDFGRQVDRHVDYLLRHRLIPFDDLFAVTRGSPDYTEERRRGVFYAQSWAFVHYLLVGQHEFEIEVEDFFDRLRDGEPAEDAYRAAFGTSTVGLRRDLEHYVSQATFDYLRLPGEVPSAERLGSPRLLEESEAAARLGLVHLAGRVDAEAAAELFRRALDLDAGNATAMGGRGELALLHGDYLQAASWFREARKRRNDDPAILDLHGLALLQRVEAEANVAIHEEPDRSAERDRLVLLARDSFARAIALAPNFPPALSGYGRTFFWDEDPSEGIEVSARAVRLLPRNPIILSTHLALVAQAGDVERAERVHAWLERPAVRATSAILTDADRALFNARYQKLIRSHETPEQYAELLAALEELASRAPDAPLQIELDRKLEELRDVVERNYWADTFNRALELLERGEHRAAETLLEEVARESTDFDIADEAERTLGRHRAASSRRR